MRQVDGVHIPGHLLAIGDAMEVAHAGILGTETPTGAHIARIGGSEFLGEYGLPLRRLYIDLKEAKMRKQFTDLMLKVILKVS